MLYIIDNGEQYSDRKIYFVEDPGYTRAQVEALLKLFTTPPIGEYPHALDIRFKVIGHVTEDWFEGKLTTFPQMMDDLDYRLSNWNDEHRFEGRRYAVELPEALRALLPRYLGENWYGGTEDKVTG